MPGRRTGGSGQTGADGNEQASAFSLIVAWQLPADL